MTIPTSTQALTKQLRSKEITTGEICEIYSTLNREDYYFPNKEIFAIELIHDRWNDQKLISFKTDYRIWALYNEMWSKLHDEDLILKKLFKQLKFVPHLLKTLETLENNMLEFAVELRKTCEMINSIISMNVSTENANIIMGRTLQFLIKMGDKENMCGMICDLVEQLKNLTGIKNIPEINSKIANVYCNELLLPTIQYISGLDKKIGDNSIVSFLKVQLRLYLFNNTVDTAKLLEKFINNNKAALEPKLLLVLYTTSISFLSKQNFTELEKIFTIIVDVQPDMTRELLLQLALSKKTMSNEFLSSILSKTLQKASEDNSYYTNFWSLLSHLLDLDIEIGIKNMVTLLDLLYEHKDHSMDEITKIWKKIVNCHINAREFLQFLEKLEKYCQENAVKSTTFLANPAFTEVISQNTVSFSTSQLKDLISGHLNRIENNPRNETTFFIFRAIIKGLENLSYTVLAELKELLSTVFTIDHTKESNIWEIRYLVMKIFDDIIPAEQFNSWHVEKETENLNLGSSREMYFYFFKLREYKEFDLDTVVTKFMNYLNQIAYQQRAESVRILFVNWATLINFIFPRDDLTGLLDFLLSEEDQSLLHALLNDDNIFEESNIISMLVSKLSKLHSSEKNQRLILRIPIQCINKTIRVGVINSICSHKSVTSELEVKVLDHLLTNPTFKSDIECDFSCLYNFVNKNLQNLKYKDVVFQRVWKNHALQIKEKKSKQFLETAIRSLSQGIENEELFKTSMQTTYLAIMTGSNISAALGEHFIKNAIHKLFNMGSVDSSVSSWLLRCLYYIFSLNDTIKPTTNQAAKLSSKILELYKEKIHDTDYDFLTSLFLLYSVLYNDKLEILFAHYLVLREIGIQSNLISKAMEEALDRYLQSDTDKFNRAFANIISSISSCPPGFTEGITELYQMHIKRINKDNKIGVHLFAASISEFYTNFARYQNSKESVLKLLDSLQHLLITKPWLYSQHSIEILFPMCLSINLIFLQCSIPCDDVFLGTISVVSNIVFAHRIKMSNRHFLINALICEYLEILSQYQGKQLTSVSARGLSRLITSVCEPNVTGNQTFKTNDLNSKIGVMKKNLRKYVPVILIKYVHISSSTPFRTSIRKELVPAIFSIFNLMSQSEMILLNAALDNAGVQYFRSLYSDYKKIGKWNTE
ncbi:hypothetical protein HG535_0B03600 [Zygotorulaspora mrakii]|uniref:Nucleolar 27S pre-rRNA processing Urb2/Npa2 C-terminal domain-containing protein n=1 Tax=Zygotorulaspora mrakii TaxID=42260 RepID=A0A7H9AYC8_ZYGMR|nr:uncharacterized protein HG535_0B03600 [Zygotorulaspora mrakii]QLG71321.1 hypothetical protein HG535_0B03600 [Zygotorulaspora mrakii]